ncbi:hypothetical protein ACQKGC_27555 [Allorhizobium pseudoryzae]|uniref:hypothetical protein n=1 Tax=Allorhizobium pseudoryzae TaxID=379684 RepID=UPI003D06152F
MDTFRVAALSSYEKLLLSGGHLFEHPAGPEIFRHHFGMFLRDQVRPVGKAKSIDDFVEVKAAQYAHTVKSENRDYSIYFRDAWKYVFDGPISFEQPKADTTSLLEQRLIDDIEALSNHQRQVLDILFERGSAAITVEIFEPVKSISGKLFKEIAERISSNYQAIYRETYGEYIFEGTGLISRNIEEGALLKYRYDLYKQLFIDLNFGRLFTGIPFRLEEFRGSVEHVRFLTNIRTFTQGLDDNDIPKLGQVLRRILPLGQIGGVVNSPIDKQLAIVSQAIEACGADKFHETYSDTLRQIQPSVGFASEVAIQYKLSGNSYMYQHEVCLVVAAPQEFSSVRRSLTRLNIRVTEGVLVGRRSAMVFDLQRGQSGESTRVYVLAASRKGKAPMKDLLDNISSAVIHPSAVIMVGMMAAIKGKSEILDVVTPLSIFDATGISTKGTETNIEPEGGRFDQVLHSLVQNMDWSDLFEGGLKLITHKKTVVVPGKFDDLTVEIAEKALSLDRENVVGLEMEAAALTERQALNEFVNESTRYLMVKGVADYAGEKIDEAEVDKLKRMLGEKSAALSDPDPTNNSELKQVLQDEATMRSVLVAIKIIQAIPMV